jgi:hypothetical protein
MKPYLNGGNAPLMAELRDARKAAANLLLEGGFNVNSSSVAAWKAFLGGLSGNDLRIWDATAKTSVQISTTSGTPFSRFWSGSGRTAPNQLWSGLRVLSDSQLDELASAIVQQVKTRGPFLSVADFLNRRLGPAGELTISGALQSAIDNTTINSSIKASGLVVKATAPAESGKVPNLIAANMKDGAGNPWNTVVGVPGYLMQQDIVQAIAPSITARSDTFLVRTYGEVRNPRSGEVEGQAWAEAVVQRFPEWVDESQNPEADIKNSNPVNVALGRRFKVVSFRWLNENEI